MILATHIITFLSTQAASRNCYKIPGGGVVIPEIHVLAMNVQTNVQRYHCLQYRSGGLRLTTEPPPAEPHLLDQYKLRKNRRSSFMRATH
ncbi:hypothetical protein F5Y19DRAFT_449805 [Xylariaceae sp. FL1651]|nr:hypothetical protein F5Y19DRAFT_449805 [Xylariaceae sp. FL1651]